MRFIDEAEIEVRAGHGGPGKVHFRREKFVPYGGPSGGDGGRGGSVIVIADRNKQTLLDFQVKTLWEAEDGVPGGTSQCEGRAGEDLVVSLPIGTVIYDTKTGNLVCDLANESQSFTLAKGGRGGRGNEFFKTATNRAPQHAQPGEPGETGSFRLSLKLVADIGIIGFPNAGKSTLISRISAARPKIADYPFTTLVPQLGVVKAKGDRNFVVADIPGLIPGAHEGKGLGIQFLKHVERTRALVHLIDPFGLNDQGDPMPPIEAFDAINLELAEFSPELAQRKQFVVFSKIDAANDTVDLDELTKPFTERGISVTKISSASGLGIPELIELLAQTVARQTTATPRETVPSPV